jgi:hypothetical protein
VIQRQQVRQSGPVPAMPGAQLSFELGAQPEVSRRVDLIPRCYELVGDLDVPRLIGCLNDLYAAHDALRVRFACADGVAFMTAADPGEAPLRLIQLEGWSEKDLLLYLRALSTQIVEGWDSYAPGATQWTLVRLDQRRHFLIGWHFYLSVDAEGLSILERQLWAEYFDNKPGIEGSSFLAEADSRRDADEPDSDTFWATELGQVGPQEWNTEDLSPLESVAAAVTGGQLKALRQRADADGVTLPDLIAHRFAVRAVELSGGEAMIVNHTVTERTGQAAIVVGKQNLTVPALMTSEDVTSAQASARKVRQAVAMRPRRSGTRLPEAYVALHTTARPFSYSYIAPDRGDSVRPTTNLRVSEVELPAPVRDPNRLRLRVIEDVEGAVQFRLYYHPDETGEPEARHFLDVIIEA